MKKTTLRLLSFLLVLILLSLILPSCNIREAALMRLGEEERALRVYEIADEKMSYSKSYTSSTELNFSFIFDGMIYDFENNIDETFLYTTEEGLYHISTVNSRTSSRETGATKERSSYTEGYCDGMVFLKGNGKARYDYMTEEDYIAYKNETQSNAFEIDSDCCEVKTCTQNDDGSWSLEFREMSDESILYFNTLLLSMGNVVKEEIVDVKICILISEDFYIQETTTTYIFADNDPAPALSVKTQYDNVNELERDNIEIIDPSKYTHVPNFHAIGKTQAAITNTAMAEGISFEVVIREELSQNNHSISSIMTYDGSFFKDNNGNLKFKYTHKKNGRSTYTVYEYSDGNLKTEERNSSDDEVLSSSESECTENRAYNIILSFIDPMNFETMDIQNVDLYSENNFDFDMSGDSPTILGSILPDISFSSSNLEVYLRDGILKRYDYSAQGHTGMLKAKVEITGKFSATLPIDDT